MKTKITSTHKKIIIFSLLLIISFPIYSFWQNYNENDVREVQLLLSLKGLYKGTIDGQAGALTKDAIRAYEVKNNLLPTGVVSKPIKEKLYEDTKSLIATNESMIGEKRNPIEQVTSEATTISSLSAELDRVKANIQNSNASLKGINDGISGYFITSFSRLVAVVISVLAILIALIGWGVGYGLSKVITYITEVS